MTDVVLQASELEYAYPCGKPGLRGASVRIERGRRLAIVGPNGSGKSTLLLCLNGTLRPQRGSILLDGAAVPAGRKAQLEWRRRIGLVFQDPDDQVVAPSVIQDVAFGPLNLGLAAPAARERAMEALAELGIECLADSGTHELSHGQKKLVALAGVLAMKPDVLLLDEPTAGLDPAGKKRLMGVLNRLQAGGATIVMATHEMDLAYAWADRTAVLKDGRTQAEDETQTVFREAAVLESAGLEMPAVPAVLERLQPSALLASGRVIRSLPDLLAALSPAGEAGTAVGKVAADGGDAILLVAFGTSVPEAETAYREIERLCRLRFPADAIRWAFTARKIRAKLAAAGRPVASPAEALARLAGDGYRRVIVQSLHVIRGQEYDELCQELERAVADDRRLHSITIGLPLLSSEADIRKVAGIMVNGMVPAERRPDEAVVWMGHGSRHHAEDAVYGALATALRQHDPLTFLGTVEGRLTRDHVAADVRKSGARRAWLLPFMAVAGDHARNDLAGSAEGSWKSLLESEGLRCVPVLKGIAEYQAIADVWLDHLASAREALTVQ